MTSNMSKGRNGYHPYYMCHHKGCASYGKSVRRDLMEGEFKDLLGTMQPIPGTVKSAEKMFRMVWDYRKHNAQAMSDSARREITGIERGIEQVMDNLMKASSATVISAYERRIEDLEKQKRVLLERLAQSTQPVRSFDESFRTAAIALPFSLLMEFANDNSVMVRLEGFEPPQVAPTAPKAVASTNSATAASQMFL